MLNLAYMGRCIVYLSKPMNASRIDKNFVEHKVLGLSEDRPVEVMDQNPAHGDSAVIADMHYELEMGIVLEGTMVRYADKTRRVCTAGDMWFCGMWEPHGYRGDEACHRVVIVIWPPALATMRFPEARDLNWMQPFIASPGRRPVIPAGLRDEAVALVKYHVARSERLTPARKRLLVMDLLVWLFENGLVERSVSNAESEPEWMVRIMPAIELAFERRYLITNTEAASACGLSRDTFIRSFRKLMGVSFSRFALRHRLGRTAEQLVKTDIPIKAIARKWGFTDASHLYRLFKQHYGCTPLAYRGTRAQLPGGRGGTQGVR